MVSRKPGRIKGQKDTPTSVQQTRRIIAELQAEGLLGRQPLGMFSKETAP